MGSLMEACCTGFICRLCSKMNRTVIFIYGADGLEHNLLEKINNYLPIQINEEDELPKTICVACMDKILLHHRLIEQIQSAQKRFVKIRSGEEQARNAVTAESGASSRTLSAESTASSRTMSVDSTDAVEEPTERIQTNNEANNETVDSSSAPTAGTANERVQEEAPANDSTSQDSSSQEATSSRNATEPGAEQTAGGTNRELNEPGSSTAKPPNRLKRKQPNPSHSSKIARKRLG
uniref:ZAD domain-containing protein n=1 Tax=Anopheles epiroticus TaxID=199890 RepID=A0A182P2G8_9DIPT